MQRIEKKKKKQIEKGQVRGFSYTLFNVLAKNAVKEERKKRKKDEIEERKSSAMLFSRIGLKEIDDCTEDEGPHTQSFLVDKQQWGKTKQELDTVKLRAVFKRQANASYIYRSQVGFLIQS